MNDSSGDTNNAVATRGGDAGVLGVLRVASVLQAKLEAALESVGLSVPKYHALEELVKCNGPIPLRVLADRQRCVRSNITQLVDRLEADGLVKRVDDPADRRGVRAVLTELGSERYAAGTEAVRQAQAELMSGLCPEDQAHFTRILAAFTSS